MQENAQTTTGTQGDNSAEWNDVASSTTVITQTLMQSIATHTSVFVAGIVVGAVLLSILSGKD